MLKKMCIKLKHENLNVNIKINYIQTLHANGNIIFKLKSLKISI